jgi:lipid A disaccharide synthetase
VQHDFTPQKIVTHLNEILPDGPARDRMLEALARVKGRLRSPQTAPGAPQHPADRAAQIVLTLNRRLKP